MGKANYSHTGACMCVHMCAHACVYKTKRGHTNTDMDMYVSAFTTQYKNLTSLFTITLVLACKSDAADLSPGFE